MKRSADNSIPVMAEDGVNATADGAALPVVFITRTEKFCASHRLHSLLLSDEENRQLYGVLNSPNGHGHNYTVKVTLRGKVDPVTGMVLNLTDVGQYIKVGVKDVLDHKYLDKDVAYFKENVSSTENLVVFIWDNLRKLLPSRYQLFEVRVHATDKEDVYYRGESE